MMLKFGAHRDKDLTDPSIPDRYIRWLALRGSYREPGNRFETKWKVPIDVSVHARREMERRGYRRVGDWYAKEGQ